MGVHLDNAVLLRPIVEKAMQSGVTDEEALAATSLFPSFDPNGHQYYSNDRFRHNDILYKVNQDHISQPDWSPDTAPSLYSKVLTDPSGKPQVWQQPDATNAYMRGDRVLFPDENGDIYRSLIDNNVWSPTDYPAGWEKE